MRIIHSEEIAEVTISSCGHVVCSHGFLGCIYEVRRKMGVVEPDEPENHPPGTVIRQRRVSDTGFPARDWVTIEGEH